MKYEINNLLYMFPLYNCYVINVFILLFIQLLIIDVYFLLICKSPKFIIDGSIVVEKHILKRQITNDRNISIKT